MPSNPKRPGPGRTGNGTTTPEAATPTDASANPRLNVGLHVAHEHGAPQINIKLLRRLQNHAWCGLAQR